MTNMTTNTTNTAETIAQQILEISHHGMFWGEYNLIDWLREGDLDGESIESLAAEWDEFCDEQ